MKRHLRISALFTSAALTCALGVSACSPSSGSAAVTSPEPAAVGTLEPLTEIEGLEGTGLELATMSVEAQPGLINYDYYGLTYAEPVTDPTADLSLHRVLWDGTEVWSATMTVPLDDDGEPLAPQMSYDDGLGAISIWFTDQKSAAKEEAYYRMPVIGMISWFELDTGEQYRVMPEQFEDLNLYSQSNFLGGIYTPNDGRTLSQVAVVTQAAELETFNLAAGDGIDEEGQLSQLGQWAGSFYFFYTAEKGSGTYSYYRNTEALVTGMSETGGLVRGFFQTAFTDDTDGGRLWVINTDAEVTEVDRGDCPILFDEATELSTSGNLVASGQLLYDAESKQTECLSDVMPSVQSQIEHVLSDGRLVLVEWKQDEDEEWQATRWLMSADHSETVELGDMSIGRTHNGYLTYYESTEDDTEIITAFSEQDLHLAQG